MTKNAISVLDLLGRLTIQEQNWLMSSSHKVAEMLRLFFSILTSPSGPENLLCWLDNWDKYVQEMRDQNLVFTDIGDMTHDS